MNILPINNSTNFEGSLSPKVVKQIRKAERIDIASVVNKANYRGEILSEETINAIRNSASRYIESLENLAKALPKKARIVLKKTFDELYIRGQFADKHMNEEFHVFYPYAGGPIGRLTNTKGEHYSMDYLNSQFKTLLEEKNIREDLALRIRDSIDAAIKKGEIKSEESLQKRYDYYKEEFPGIEIYRKRHLGRIEDYKIKANVEKENSKYLPLGRRILAKFGF